eukprot:jgi/Ulvmu1/10813/UM069_0049.1
MPVIGVPRDKLFERLGREYTEEEFDALCFEYGIELDDVTSEAELLRKERGAAAGAAGASEDVIYKIDIPANRYDMLCLEGIARALNIFLGRDPAPTYAVVPGPERLTVEAETALVRPFVVAAVLRGVTLDAATYDSFIDLQDKLHQNLCRQRTLVAIGTHDLDSLQGPFTYRALPPEEITFTPLKQTEPFRADRLMAHYLEHDAKLKKFVPIIQGSPVFPVITDAAGTVLSLPPIINGAHSAIKLSTKNIFIECTATDLTKAHVVLNTVVTMFSEYCAKPFQVESVAVTDALGATAATPDLAPRSMDVTAAYVNSYIGIDLPAAKMAQLLTKMQLASTVAADGAGLVVSVPPTRSDVLHACDVAEDVAIAFGYNNVAQALPPTATAGAELPLNALTELLRGDLAAAGFTEVLTWALCSHAENFANLRREDDGAVRLSNPATVEFQVARTKLLPSALKTLAANRDAPLPVQLFEISDVVLLDPAKDVGARNERRLVAVNVNNSSGFEVIHGLLNRIMDVLGVPLAGEELPGSSAPGYTWKASALPEFFPGRQAEVSYAGQVVGSFGIVHPEVLENFEMAFPVSALELNLEPFCFDQSGKSLLDKFSCEVKV